MPEVGKNPLMKDGNILRLNPKLKVKNQIGFPLTRGDRFIIPLKSRFKNAETLLPKEIPYEVNLQGEMFGYDEIWCSLKSDQNTINDLGRELNHHYKLSKPEVSTAAV